MTTAQEIVNRALGPPPNQIEPETLRDYARITISWLMYQCCDIAWHLGAGAWPGHYWEWPYRVYSWFALQSDEWQGDLKGGPWSPVEPEPSEQHLGSWF